MRNMVNIEGASFSVVMKLILLLFNLSGLITRQYLSCGAGNCLFIYQAYTVQTNMMVLIWLILWWSWRSDRQKQQRLSGSIRGAITLYISVTWLVFMVALEPIYDPTGLELYPTIVNHYIVPILFILDWFFTEKEIVYQWRWLVFWVIYPLSYLIFSLAYGSLTGTYLYFFLDLPELGLLYFLVSVSLLLVFFMILGALYITVNRRQQTRVHIHTK